MAEDKSITRLLRLKDNHSTVIKLNKLWRVMDELGISISVSHGITTVDDKDRNATLPKIHMLDLEHSDESVEDFPPVMEYKLVYENPEYLEKERQERAIDDARRAAENKAREEKLKAEKLAREKELAMQKEKEERRLLSELKAKYESA